MEAGYAPATVNAMLAALKQTNDFVLSQGKPLDLQSAAAYEDILAHQKKEC